MLNFPSTRTCTEPQFLQDVSQHVMTVLLNQGIYRHLRFQKPNTSVNGFSLITWPGHLCYTGDMGSYLFNRVQDMFCFFRTENLNPLRQGGSLEINLGYWAEKCLAVDRHDGIKQYSPDRFRQVITDWLDDQEASEDLRKVVQEELLHYAEDGEHEVHRLVADFEHDGVTFLDFWEVDLKEYSHHFVWACYAIAWGIQQYDKAGLAQPSVAQATK